MNEPWARLLLTVAWSEIWKVSARDACEMPVCRKRQAGCWFDGLCKPHAHRWKVRRQCPQLDRKKKVSQRPALSWLFRKDSNSMSSQGWIFSPNFQQSSPYATLTFLQPMQETSLSLSLPVDALDDPLHAVPHALAACGWAGLDLPDAVLEEEEKKRPWTVFIDGLIAH